MCLIFLLLLKVNGLYPIEKSNVHRGASFNSKATFGVVVAQYGMLVLIVAFCAKAVAVAKKSTATRAVKFFRRTIIL